MWIAYHLIYTKRHDKHSPLIQANSYGEPFYDFWRDGYLDRLLGEEWISQSAYEFAFWLAQQEYNTITAREQRRQSQTHKGRLRKKLLKEIGACQLCGANPKETSQLHLHRIIPASNGGEYELSNVMLVCQHCHRSAEALDREELAEKIVVGELYDEAST
jgi:hypothetical protein